MGETTRLTLSHLPFFYPQTSLFSMYEEDEDIGALCFISVAFTVSAVNILRSWLVMKFSQSHMYLTLLFSEIAAPDLAFVPRAGIR